MREIKFRAWDIDNKEMFYNAEATYDDRCDGRGCDDQSFVDVLEDSERYIVEQYTGLKDKNGKEIYEGDILNCEDAWWNAAGPTHHESPIIVVEWNKYHCGFDPFADYDCDCGVYIEGQQVEVIGNIHEDPEICMG